jgi:hypothetical protein
MEIKFKLDTKKATCATVAIAAAYALIAILYGPRPASTKTN